MTRQGILAVDSMAGSLEKLCVVLAVCTCTPNPDIS